MTTIKLPPYDAINGKYFTKEDHYKSYKIWRKSVGYNLWLKKQWKLQDGKCFYCKVSLREKIHNVEHIIPQSWWGETNAKNIVLSCQPCNKQKGSNLPAKKFRNVKKKKTITSLYKK